MYQFTLDEALEFYERAIEEKIPDDKMEEFFIQFVKEKKKKSIGATEMSLEELANNEAKKGKKVLYIKKKEGE